MFCPDFCCLLEDFTADDRLVGIGDNHPPVIRYYDSLPGFVIHNLLFQQDQITGVFAGGHGCLLEKRSLPEDLLERVAVMEQRFDRLLAAVEKPDVLQKDESLKQALRELTAYYECGMWLEDYRRDERGELPRGMKRGVLSEDGVYNLLALLQPYMKEER